MRARSVVGIPLRATGVHRPTDVRCHTSTDLDRCTPVARSGIPTTDLARTAAGPRQVRQLVTAQPHHRGRAAQARAPAPDADPHPDAARPAGTPRHPDLRAVIDAHADRDGGHRQRVRDARPQPAGGARHPGSSAAPSASRSGRVSSPRSTSPGLTAGWRSSSRANTIARTRQSGRPTSSRSSSSRDSAGPSSRSAGVPTWIDGSGC